MKVANNKREFYSYSEWLNPFTLNFLSKNLNEKFNIDLVKRTLWLSRGSILFAIGLYLIYGILDEYILPLAEAEVITIRMVGILIFGIVLALTFISGLQKYYQLIMMLFIVLGGMDVAWLVLISEHYGGYGIYVGLILTIIYAHSLLRLRFMLATFSTWLLVIFYISAAILLNDIPLQNLINNIFFLIAANMLGMFASYGIEYYMRSDFWKAQQIDEQSKLLESEYKRKSNELEAARQIQLSMLPQVLPQHPRLDIAVCMCTASEIGGDYYDFHLSDDDNLTFAIGDATGHGAQAGAMVTAIKTLFSNYAPHMEITEFLKKANHFVKQIKLPRLYMSLAVGKIKNDTLEISGIGLPPLFIFRSLKDSIEEVPLKGMPLGSFMNFPFIKRTIKLYPDDTLVFMTDGLPELFNTKKEMFGYQQVKDIVVSNISKPVNDILKEINQNAVSWNPDQQQDDMTLLVMKMKSTNEETESSLNIPLQFSLNNNILN